MPGLASSGFKRHARGLPMSSDVAIKVSNVSKHYQVYEKPVDRIKQSLFRGKRQYYTEFRALNNISFEVNKGETVGIIGINGSGKSTLLQMICGTLTPTNGDINLNGRVAALLELGAGFNPEFTGRENVYMNATILGLCKHEIDIKYNDIVEFADIGEFIEQPVKTYSSGMYVRLAFAVIAHVEADILVIDEALSVGDAFFVQKCMRYLREFMKNGTVIFVSHDTGAVVNLCDRVALIDHGKIVEIGEPKTVVGHYLAALYGKNQKVGGVIEDGRKAKPNHVREFNKDEYRDIRDSLINESTLRNDIEVFKFETDQDGFGTGDAKIVFVQLLDKNNIPLSWVVGGEDVILEICCKAYKEIPRPIIGFQFIDRLGQVVFADNTYLVYKSKPLLVEKGAELVAKFEFRLPKLPTGEYSIAPAIADGSQDSHIQLHWLHDALMVKVHASSVCLGLVGVPMKNITLVIQ